LLGSIDQSRSAKPFNMVSGQRAAAMGISFVYFSGVHSSLYCVGLIRTASNGSNYQMLNLECNAIQQKGANASSTTLFRRIAIIEKRIVAQLDKISELKAQGRASDAAEEMLHWLRESQRSMCGSLKALRELARLTKLHGSA